MSMSTKLIVTNRKVLRAKYQTKGLKKIEARLRTLVAADKKRGVTTQIIAMDIKSSVTPHGAPQIKDHKSAKQTKDCVDALFDATQPDYLMILGAPDVVCHQALDNPVSGDEDRDVPSDLPYACSAPFSSDISDFVGPTRAIGRLPDVAGEYHPTALLAGLDTAITWRRRSRRSYDACCGISTDSWKGSTRKSTKKIFGRTQVQFLSPTAGAPWSKKELRPRMHFVNCHGLDFDTSFYGDDGFGNQPPVIDESDYNGRLREGTVMAAECCFGAMLYDAPNFAISPGICNAAIANGVYGFLGSTNVAYGPASSTGYADLICQYFMINVRKGASTGRALLESRQQYASGEAPLDPVDLKTLAQFNLLGDPSVHPVKMVTPAKKGKIAKTALPTTSARRRKLRRKGLQIGRSIACVGSIADSFVNDAMRASIVDRLPNDHITKTGEVLSFEIRSAKQPALAKSKSAIRKAEGGGRYHVVGAVDSRTKRPAAKVAEKAHKRHPGPDILMIAHERDSTITYTKTVYRR